MHVCACVYDIVCVCTCGCFHCRIPTLFSIIDCPSNNIMSLCFLIQEQEQEVKRSDQRLQKIVDALEKLLLPGRAEKKRHMQHSQKEAETGSAYC